MKTKNTFVEFDKIIHLLEQECHCELGKILARNLAPLTDIEAINYKLEIISEFQDLATSEIALHDICDLNSLFTEFIYEIFNFEECRQIYFNISAGNRILHKIKVFENKEKINELVHELSFLQELEDSYNRIFSSDGEVQDSASAKLAAIRRRKISLRRNITTEISKKIEYFDKEKFLFDKISTQRNGRFVIPVKENSVAFIPGIVHGKSAGKASVYIEPQEVVVLNNEMDLLHSDEKQEIYRILKEFSGEIKEEKDTIIRNTKVLQKLDFYRAAGSLSRKFESTKPEILPEPYIKLAQARHPILINTLGAADKVIPFDLELGKDFNILLISGPNTGGKTVTLKSVGILTMMALSGLPIPADENSKIGIFTEFYSDIGDDQSLEDALSTFSSHIGNIKAMLRAKSNKALVLIDEIGAATDPEQGSALAQAILETLAQKNVIGVITTHYTSLKIFAEKNEKCRNAAMHFDHNKHIPTYKFKLGMPGNSFAIEIASGLGLAEKLISRAKELTGNQSVELTEILKKMSKEKIELGRQSYQFKLKTALLNKKVIELEEKLRLVEADAKLQKKLSLKKTGEYLSGLQIELNSEISELKKADRKQRKNLLESQLKKISGMNSELRNQEDALFSDQKIPVRVPELGMNVWVKDLEAEGEIIEIFRDSVKIDMNGISFKVASKNIFELKKVKKKATSKKISAPRPKIRQELKILGKTFDEAKPLIDIFLDDAVLSGLNKVRIVHGKGTGALRSKVRSYLRKTKKEFYTPVPEAGGDGVTVVSLEE